MLVPGVISQFLVFLFPFLLEPILSLKSHQTPEQDLECSTHGSHANGDGAIVPNFTGAPYPSGQNLA